MWQRQVGRMARVVDGHVHLQVGPAPHGLPEYLAALGDLQPAEFYGLDVRDRCTTPGTGAPGET